MSQLSDEHPQQTKNRRKFLNLIIGILKIVFLLGFLILIHELGHFLVAKLFNVKIKQFAIGFGPTIWKKQGTEILGQCNLRYINDSSFRSAGHHWHQHAERGLREGRMQLLQCGGL